MKMTIRRKLWLGFSGMILLIALWGYSEALNITALQSFSEQAKPRVAQTNGGRGAHKMAVASSDRARQILETVKRQALFKGVIVGLFLVFCLVISINIVLSMTRSILLPIEELEKAAGEIGKGNFDAAVKIRSKDEIGSLGDAFNLMARNLRTLIQHDKEAVLADARVVAEKQKADELLTLKQQLAVSEQSLKVSDQQLLAKERQLLANERALMTEKAGLEKKVKEHIKDLEEANASLEVKTQRGAHELQEKVAAFDKLNAFMSKRELEIVALKKEVNELCKEFGRQERYFRGAL